MAKTTKVSELRKYDDEKLAAEVTALKRKLFELRSQAATEKIEDVSQFRKIRREVARLLTEAGARKRPSAGAAATPAPKRAAEPKKRGGTRAATSTRKAVK